MAQQHCLHEGLGERVVLIWHGHGNAQLPPNLVRLADDDLKDGAIHGVVGSVHQRGADLLAGLTKAVHAPFTLLMPRGVPGQVVVDHGVKVLLQVDAFRQAVRGHQHALFRLTQEIHFLLPLRGRNLTGHHANHHLGGRPLELLLQLRGNVMRGGNVPAEHHRTEPILQQGLHVLDEDLQLGVHALEPLRFGDERLELLSFRSGWRVSTSSSGSASEAPSKRRSSNAPSSSCSWPARVLRAWTAAAGLNVSRTA